MKPSERILEIYKALKVLDDKEPDEPSFYETKAIIQYLDEKYKELNPSTQPKIIKKI